MASIGEFFVTLGVTGNAVTTVKDLVSKFGDLEAITAAELGGLSAMAAKFYAISEAAYDTAAAFKLFETRTGLSSQELQRWQIVAEQMNVSGQAVAQSVEALQHRITDIRLGYGNIKPFQLLGLDPTGMNPFQLLDALRQRLQHFSPAMATNILGQLGLSPDMLAVLRLSDAEFQKIVGSEIGMTKKQEEAFLEAKRGFVEFEQTVRFGGYNLVYIFTRLGEVLLGLPIPLKALGLALAAYFFPVTAAVVGLLLLLDDLATYMQGGKSIIGLLAKEFGGAGAPGSPMYSPVGAAAQTGAIGAAVHSTNFFLDITSAGPVAQLEQMVERIVRRAQDREHTQAQHQSNNQDVR